MPAANGLKKFPSARALARQNSALQREIDQMWSRLSLLEGRLAKGEYNPSTTKVFHCSTAPPCALCVGLRAELREANKMLEEQRQNVGLSEESQQLKRALKEQEIYVDRLQKETARVLREFKEVRCGHGVWLGMTFRRSASPCSGSPCPVFHRQRATAGRRRISIRWDSSGREGLI